MSESGVRDWKIENENTYILIEISMNEILKKVT